MHPDVPEANAYARRMASEHWQGMSFQEAWSNFLEFSYRWGLVWDKALYDANPLRPYKRHELELIAAQKEPEIRLRADMDSPSGEFLMMDTEWTGDVGRLLWVQHTKQVGQRKQFTLTHLEGQTLQARDFGVETVPCKHCNRLVAEFASMTVLPRPGASARAHISQRVEVLHCICTRCAETLDALASIEGLGK
jgi:hypothetical protein